MGEGITWFLQNFHPIILAPNHPLLMSDKIAFIQELQQLTKDLALRVIQVYRQLPPTEESRVIGKQLLRSATSVGANYRAVCRARSGAEHYAKLSICVEEADETLFWLELLMETGIVATGRLQPLHQEYTRVVSILARARKTAS